MEKYGGFKNKGGVVQIEILLKGKKHGDMYTMKSFRDSHSRAVRKIGLTVGKMLRTTEHGHRHAYGQRVSNAKIDL